MATFPLKPRVPIINWNNPITKGLVMDVPMFEGGGVSPKEIVNSLITSFVNTPTWVIDLFGKSMSFTTNQAVKILNNTILNPTNGNTVAVLFKSNGTQNLPANLLKKDNSYILRLNDTDNFRWIPFNGGGSVIVGYNGQTYTTGKWFLMVGTDIPGSQVLYLDGVKVASTTTATALSNGSNNLGIGADPAGTEPFNGVIAFARIWNRAISAQEVKQLYTNPWQIYKKMNFPFRFSRR